MRTNYKIAVWVVLILCNLYTFAQGQNITPSIDPEREVIVMFKSDAVIPPANRTAGRPDEFQIPEQGLRQLLLNANVEAISRLMSDFRPEDRYAVSRTGEEVQLTDWTHVYVLRLPQPEAREGFLNALKSRSGVIFAEPNGRGEPDLIPNDQYFNRQWAWKNDGTGIQGNGNPGADIKATQAWDITTGSSTIKIGIVDAGMQTNHPDFTGRVTGDAGDSNPHGTAVAGVAAAQGNNAIGVAGAAWNVEIINEDYGLATDASLAASVRSASNRGADIINNSWKLVPIGRYSITVRLAFADVYKLNRVTVASMGNQYETMGENATQYPAAFGQGILTVGATTNTDVKASYSSTGSWIDVTAPGGGVASREGEGTKYNNIFTTVPGSCYDWYLNYGGFLHDIRGTSFAAPVATGIAALLLSYNPNLYNDDIEQIIRLGVDDKGDPGFDTWYGTGRVNARKALDLIRSPNELQHRGAYGGSNVATTFLRIQFIDVPGLSSYWSYFAFRHKVQKTVTFPPFVTTPYVWGRGVGTIGFSDVDSTNSVNTHYGMGWCRVIPGSVTSTSATLETYVYDVYNLAMDHIGWFPCEPSEVQFKYTALGELMSVHLSGWMECINPPKSGVETKDVYHFRAHLWWTYDGPLDHYELYRKLLKPREGDPTGWWRIYYGSNTSKIDPYDFEKDDAAWYYVKAYITGGPYSQSNTIYLVADVPPSPPQGLSGVWEHIGKDWADITLHWNPNSESDLSGYYIYRSESSGGTFNNIGTVEPLDEPVFVDRVYAWEPYWYYVTAFDLSENESEPSDIIRVDPEYYPGPCPFLFTWNGSEFLEDNNILMGSGQGEVVTDPYKLSQALIETEPPRRYKLEIREEETEHSFFDMVSLKVVDHPQDIEIGINVDDEIMPVSTAHIPVSAISGGEDYVDVLVSDTTWFEGCAGDTMLIEFGIIDEVDDKELWFESDKSGYPISIEIEGEDGWEYITSVFPRDNFSQIPITSLSELIDNGEGLTLRLVWFADHNLKTIRIVQPEDELIVERTSPLVFAIHSRLGNVIQELLNEDEDYVEVLPGDTLRLEFAFLPEIPDCNRSFVFISNGYYTTETGDGGTQTATSDIPLVHSMSLFPNPAKSDMTIRFGIPGEEQVSLKVYDVSGREVETLENRRLKAGYYTIRLDNMNLPSGIYFARLVTDNFEETKKLVLIK